MKQKIIILISTLLLFSSLYPCISTAQEQSIILSVPSEVEEGEQFQVKASLPEFGTGEPEEPGIVTIEFLGILYQTNQKGVLFLTAPFVESDTQYQIIARKTGYEEATRTITVKDMAPSPGEEQPQLHVSSPLSVSEEEIFTITIIANDLPVPSVLVSFNEQSKTTNTHGTVEFTAPTVHEDTIYTIVARKTGYLSDTKEIMVLSKKPATSENSWIYGSITDTSGQVLEDATICIIYPNTENCTKTNQNGEYNMSIPPGRYDIKAEKQGYVTSIKYQISIQENTAIQQNFILETITESIPLETYNTGALIIQWGVENRVIGAQLITTKETIQSTIYDSELTLEVILEKEGELGVIITGPDNSPGTIIALNIGHTKTLFNTTIRELSTLMVTYDGAPIPQATSFEEIFNLSNTAATPQWAALITGDTLTILINIPHFSTHEIRIYAIEHMVETLGGMTALILYGLTIAVFAVVTAVPIIRLWKKIE